jgi:hypothetical protein
MRSFLPKKVRLQSEPGGGATVAAATREFGNGMILSSGAHPGLEKTAEASGEGFKIFQLFTSGAMHVGR